VTFNANSNSNICSGTGDDRRKNGHVAIFPSIGMSHFMPFLHLARFLAINYDFSITFITTKGNISPSQTAHVQGITSSNLDIYMVQLAISSPSNGRNKDEGPFFV
jgi:hypothetical protein